MLVYFTNRIPGHKNWLGHTDIHITLDMYADVFDRMNLGAISEFESLIEEVMADE